MVVKKVVEGITKWLLKKEKLGVVFWDVSRLMNGEVESEEKKKREVGRAVLPSFI